MNTKNHVVDDLRKRVREALPDGRLKSADGKSMRQVAEDAGLHVVTVQKFRSGLLDLKPETVERLADVLGLKLKLVESAAA
jgi:transcriptional regulator with XRE-family HTH domain